MVKQSNRRDGKIFPLKISKQCFYMIILIEGCDKFSMMKGGAYLTGGVLKSVQSNNYGTYDKDLSDQLDF